MTRPYIIGITGGSGSGKTSFIKRLREAYSEEELCVISQDEYYKPRDIQKEDKNGIRNFDLPKSIDKKAFAKDLKSLITGEEVVREEYTFNNSLKEPVTLTFRPAPVIIVEGLFVLHYKKIKELVDLKIFLHAKENLKVIRRIRRDQVERNYPLDDVLYRYEYHVLPTFEKYIQPYMDEADIIINNNHAFDKGLDVVMGFLNQKLSKK